MPERTSPVEARPKTSEAVHSHRWRRVRFDAPPPRASALSGWALLPLRVFLGFTFCFAGVQKLANPNFFNANSPSSIQAQLIGSIRISPLHQLLGHLLRFAVPIGIMIAVAELAVGMGAILGLWTRVAAVGGMVLSLMLFLTVSFHSSPYYTGADIVFVFAWFPLVLAGSGGVLSLDALILRGWLLSTTLVRLLSFLSASPLFSRCAITTRTTSVLRRRAAAATSAAAPSCRPTGSGRGVTVSPGGLDAVDRRTVVLGAAAALAVGVFAGTAAGLGRAVGGAKANGSQGVSLVPSPTSQSRTPGSIPATTAPPVPATSSTTSPVGTPIGPASQVPVGGAANFKDPNTGDPALLLQPAKGRFVAYDAICPHAGCTVGYSSATNLIVCPCHGSEFDPSTGAVVRPPAARGLTPIQVAVDSKGEIRVDG